MSPRELNILGCSSQQPTRMRNHGAYFLRWNGCGFLFDPGEGTQRQFIFAHEGVGIAPTGVTHIFVSHFHGDHCLGLGSMLIRLNLDKVTHPIHCYYPASGQVYFERLRYGTIYHEQIKVIPHPVAKEGLVEENEFFRIEAFSLRHGIENFAWRITERDRRRFDRKKLGDFGVFGRAVRQLEEQGQLQINGCLVTLDDVSSLSPGDSFAVVIDTLPCAGALRAAKNAQMLLCESTYLEEDCDLARKYMHMTAGQAAQLALESNVGTLVLTHFSARYQDPESFKREAEKIFPNVFIAADFKTFPFPRKPLG